ncbi:MAG: isoprenylcysteine carboxylmethyltransferase family protein [Rhodocyclales bacterium]|nr:isoprenylcysteine carboxylmethyltransferase family protein [Rhodocyclales bacterium]
MTEPSAYGLWLLVILNSAVFILFAASFFKPQSRQDWRTLGLFSAFVVALFTEMYGFPLTIYLLSGWLAERVPGVDFLSHDAGHLLEILFGWRANPHFGPFHLLSTLFIIGGFWLLAKAWPVLYAAQQGGTLATSGPYARIRHPQYAAFLLVMTGFLLQWPTLVTAAMFPILAFTYVRLAHREEREALARFGDAYRAYVDEVPGWWPRFK